MAFSVEDFSDLLKLLETHPEWRQELRRVLFPEIDLPKALQELAEAQRQTEAAIERLEVIVERMAERMEAGFTEAAADRKAIREEAAADRKAIREEMAAQFAEAAADRKAIRGEMAAGFAEAAADREIMKQDLRTLKGKSHEQFYRDKATAIFGRHLRRGRDATEWVATQLQAAQASDQISVEEYDQVLAADLLWQGQLRTNQEEVILVLEASWRVEAGDVERAAARASILRRLGLKALPVAAGQEWAEEVRQMALEHQVVLTDNGRIDDASWQAALSD